MKASASTTVRRKAGKVLTGFGSEFTYEDQLSCGCFGIGEHVYARLVVCRDIEGGPSRGRTDGSAFLYGFAVWRGGEVFFHLGLDKLGIEVTDGDDGHEVGPVPAFVELD